MKYVKTYNTKYKEALQLYSKENIHNYYCIENHTLNECITHFNLSKDIFKKVCKFYNINKNNYINNVTNRIKIEDLYNYYIKENHTKKETQEHFNVKDNILFGKLLKSYNIFKHTPHTKLKLKVNSEELYDYYIQEDHSREETQEHFNISKSLLSKMLKTYDIIKNETFKTILSRINKEDFYKYYIQENHTYEDTYNHFNISKTSMWFLCVHYGIYKENWDYDISSSSYEDEIANILTNNKVEFQRHNRTILDGRELDFYLPKYNIAIEFNGDYWHSSLKLDKHYHEIKSKLAESKGIRLIHIYEYEWNNINTKNILLSILNISTDNIKNRLYARKCEVRKITNNQAKPFNDQNHLQGHRNAQVTYGLFYKDKLVQLMSFSKTKYNKNLKDENAWEIIRGCPGSNNLVIGGVSRLFKHFLKDYNPSSIFSYCDFNKFDGKGYEKIGMKCIGYTGPDKKWWMKDGSVLNRQPSKYKTLKENAKAVIWGSGSKKYLWINPDFKENLNEIQN